MVTIRGASGNNTGGSSASAALPSGSAAGDRAFLFAGGAWGFDPSGGDMGSWDSVTDGTTGGGTPLIYRFFSKVLDSGDISAGSVTLNAFGGGFGWAMAVTEGDCAWRDPYALYAGSTGNSSNPSLDSESNVVTGDLCLIFAEVRNWSSTTCDKGDELAGYGDSDGYTGTVNAYEAVADGVFTAHWSVVWGGSFTSLILPLIGGGGAPIRRRAIIVC